MMDSIKINDALRELGVTEYAIIGSVNNESDFNNNFKKITATDKDGNGTFSSDPKDWGVTWSQLKTKYDVLVKDEPLKLLREKRNAKLTETDWVVIKEREEGGSVSNFADWKKYRQELRDITKTYKSLEDVKWPTAPSE